MSLLSQVLNFTRSLVRDKSPVETNEHSGHEVAEEAKAHLRLRRRLIGFAPDVTRLTKGAEKYTDEI